MDAYDRYERFAVREGIKMISYERDTKIINAASFTFTIEREDHALSLSQVLETSILDVMTATISSAKGEISIFRRNVKLLVVMCIISAICSGIRVYCFGIAEKVLVKRMRERLYSSLLRQDISFFDNETVAADLSTRLGADCQKVSSIIGSCKNANVRKGVGALIYLLILSRPFGLCTFFICCVIAVTTIFCDHDIL